eukprot:TRINITY_DN203_c1_g1_i3.p1 TRINITY_DN203_c1_g1~~TRINITY_DN203_c1_g1_i3.p1  ORF type:complete len:592 (-),score=148.16 TRINITY_DN203_c1_g1_i3:956-2731(-)
MRMLRLQSHTRPLQGGVHIARACEAVECAYRRSLALIGASHNHPLAALAAAEAEEETPAWHRLALCCTMLESAFGEEQMALLDIEIAHAAASGIVDVCACFIENVHYDVQCVLDVLRTLDLRAAFCGLIAAIRAYYSVSEQAPEADPGSFGCAGAAVCGVLQQLLWAHARLLRDTILLLCVVFRRQPKDLGTPEFFVELRRTVLPRANRLGEALRVLRWQCQLRCQRKASHDVDVDLERFSSLNISDKAPKPSDGSSSAFQCRLLVQQFYSRIISEGGGALLCPAQQRNFVALLCDVARRFVAFMYPTTKGLTRCSAFYASAGCHAHKLRYVFMVAHPECPAGDVSMDGEEEEQEVQCGISLTPHLLGEGYLALGWFEKAVSSFKLAAQLCYDPEHYITVWYRAPTGTATLPALSSSDPSAPTFDLCAYYAKCMMLFEVVKQTDIALDFAGLAWEQRPPKEFHMMLLTSMFTDNLSLRRFSAAFEVLGRMPPEKTDDFVQHLVGSCSVSALSSLVGAQLTTAQEAAAADLLLRRAAVQQPALPQHPSVNYYDVAYAFLMARGQLQRAAAAMVEQARRIARSTAISCGAFCT